MRPRKTDLGDRIERSRQRVTRTNPANLTAKAVKAYHLEDGIVGSGGMAQHANEYHDPDMALASDLASYVAKALYDAYSILMATTDNTPIALTVAEQRLVGRITGGNIAALTAAQVLTLLGHGGVSPADHHNPVSKSSTLTVAANTASAAQKAAADYLCDGTADEVQINAAIAALPAAGGTVTLTEGTFIVAASISIPTSAKLRLVGQGRQKTTIATAAAFASDIIAAVGPLGNCEFEHFLVDGTNQTAGSGINCRYMASARFYNVDVRNCFADGFTKSAVAQDADGIVFLACEAASNGGRGWTLANFYAGRIWGSAATSNVDDGMYISGSDNMIQGCVLDSNGGHGVEIDSSLRTRIVGSYIGGNTGYGVNEINAADYSVVAANSFTGNVAGTINRVGVDTSIVGNPGISDRLPAGIQTDTIAEETATAGVTIDGSKIKDFFFYPDPVTSPSMRVGRTGNLFYFSYDGNNYVLYNAGSLTWYFYNGGNSLLELGATSISAVTHPITDVVDPTNAQDAATKNYVDATHGGAADPHTVYQKESEREAVSGYAGLNASQKVIRDPANATATPTASKIPIADGSTPPTLNGWNNRITAAPGADVTASGVTITLQAGVTMAFGDVGYIAATGKVLLGKADAIATANCTVMCAVAAGLAADASGDFLMLGVARRDAWAWTVGGLVYLSITGTTTNTLTQTAPSGVDHVIQILGVATHADRILFNPSLVQVEHT